MFDTRDPENPVTDNQTLPPPLTKEALYSNFQNSLQQKNLAEYEKLFADSATHKQQFLFIPNQSAAVRYSSIFPTWNKTSEVDYFRNIITSIGASSIQFTTTSSPQIITYQSDSALYTIQYSLFVPHNRPGTTTQFEGRSELYMSPNKNNIWVIYRWIDFETKKDSSWSELKGQFAK
ncbi:MAG: hypothetical protein HYV29_03930 [Ignavibacteriales bacterium]|nr:hypothetical protein [Ignavibacteriales bacterium]